MSVKNSYLPVDPVFYDIAETFKGKNARVFYFDNNQSLEESNGLLNGIVKNSSGEFLDIVSGNNVRIDRIITINGKPGPAFDEYDSYANACLSCQAGYDD